MTKRTQFVVLVLALMVPFFALVMYASIHNPGGAWPNPWPLWLRYAIPAWFMANVLLTLVLQRRMLSRGIAEPEKMRLARAISLRVSVDLGFLWLLIFLYVLDGGIRGRFPLSRAIAPAIFLLLFNGFPGWAIYLGERGKA
jgi:hypothetical protein